MKLLFVLLCYAIGGFIGFVAGVLIILVISSHNHA